MGQTVYSAVFEKVVTSGKVGLHFQPVPPNVHPMLRREVHGCSQFWKRAGFEFPDFGVWPLGPRPANVFFQFFSIFGECFCRFRAVSHILRLACFLAVLAAPGRQNATWVAEKTLFLKNWQIYGR